MILDLFQHRRRRLPRERGRNEGNKTMGGEVKKQVDLG